MRTIACLLLVACSLWGQSRIPLAVYSGRWRPSTTCLDTTVGIINSAGDQVAFIIQVPATGSIDAVDFLTGTVTTADDLAVSLQDVSTSTGDPDGTADQTATVALDAADDRVWKTATFNTARSVTAGQYVAVVIGVGSYVDANLTLALAHSAAGAAINGYVDVSDGSAWTKQATHGVLLGLHYTTTGYVAGDAFLPLGACVAASLSTSSSPDEAGLRFQTTAAVTIVGAQFVGDIDGDFDVVLYDASSTALATTSIDSTQRSSSGIGNVVVDLPATSLSANTTYRLAVKPTSTTISTLLYSDVGSNARLGAWPLGIQAYLTSRTDAGSWTDTNTQIPNLIPIFSALPTGGSAGTRSYATQ